MSADAARSAGSLPGFPAELTTRLGDLLEARLWHEASTVLLEVVDACDGKIGSEEFVRFYKDVVVPVRENIGALVLARVQQLVSSSISDPVERVAFLKEAGETLEALISKTDSSKGHGAILHLASLARGYVAVGDLVAAKKIVDEGAEKMKAHDSVPGAVYTQHHRASCDYYYNCGPPEAFYNSARLLMLRGNESSMSQEDAEEFAYKTGLSALIGESVFDFGDLLDAPLMAALAEGPRAWFHELLHAFRSGSVSEYKACIAKHSGALNSAEVLKDSCSLLDEKISILALIGACTALPAGEGARVLTFDQITEATAVQGTHVELLLIKALAEGLVEGKINSVKGVFTLHGIKAYRLNVEGVRALRERVGALKGRVASTAGTFERHAKTGVLASAN